MNILDDFIRTSFLAAETNGQFMYCSSATVLLTKGQTNDGPKTRPPIGAVLLHTM